MVYQCPKCKRRWQQPINVCPYCLIEVERMKSEATEVVVSSKVNMTSFFHMNVPYFANIVKDGKGNLFSLKSEERIERVETKSDPGSVAVFRLKYDIVEGLENVFKLLEISLSENQKVMVIPTVVSPNHSYLRENTSPEFLEAVLDFLLEKKVKVKVGAQIFNEIPTEAMAQKAGLLEICFKKAITPFDLAKAKFVRKEDLEISEEVFSADLVLNLGMLKAGKAASTENVFRVMKKENYSGLKYLQSEKEIAEKLSKNLSNILTVGEAETVQGKNGITTYLGLIFAGKSFLNVDALFNRIVGEKETPEPIKEINPESIIVSGRKVKEVEREI